MIRTTNEAPFFWLWSDSAVLQALVFPQFLTTARYEPTLRRLHGIGHIDLTFESGAQSCVISGIRLDPNHLLIRHRSPVVWPAKVAGLVSPEQLAAIEPVIVPWLRSLARAHHMAMESIRRFAPSARFDRARASDFVGAAPLDRAMLRMAPFVYARRFAHAARVRIACSEAALARAILADVAAEIDDVSAPAPATDFARAWYGLTPVASRPQMVADVLVVDVRGEHQAPYIIETQPTPASTAALVDVPAPVPWDLLFSFDVADAPAAGRFGVAAIEPRLREPEPFVAAPVFGGSAGAIVLAVNSELAGLQGPEAHEIRIFAGRLAAEGFSVHVSSDPGEAAVAQAQLIHIFGSPFEYHAIAFAERALAAGIDFVFDLTPLSDGPSTFMETTLYLIYISSHDDADIARYLAAYERRLLEAPADPNSPPEPEPEEYARIAARFCELAGRATAVLALEEDVAAVRTLLGPQAADRVCARGIFAEAEPASAPIGHVVPREPFALVHTAIARRSNALLIAVAAERRGIPLVIAGPVYEVDYLQALRTNAPSAVVLADADAATVSALYRAAAVWVDAARRPRTAASLVRAVACGALPVVTDESPLVRLTLDAAPMFALTSIDDCGRAIAEAMASPQTGARVAALLQRLDPRRDAGRAFGSVIAAYTRATTSV